MKSKYNWEITLRFNEFHLIVAFIIFTHLGILNTIIPNSHTQIIEEEGTVALEDEEKAEELTLEEKLKLLRERKIMGLVYIGDQKVYNQRILDELLDSKVMTKAKLSEHVINTNFAGISNKETISKVDSANIELSEYEKKALAFKLLKKRVGSYKQCYLKYQKIDQLLEGFVDMKIHPKSNHLISQVRFSGVGQRHVINQLESCIEAELAKIYFPGELAGNTYRLKVKL